MAADNLKDFAGASLERPLVMGILNVTPDSFSDGGKFNGVDTAPTRAREMVAGGVDFIDVGGESTRPGSDAVSVQDEIARVIPVIEALHGVGIGPISIDTRKADVMRAAISSGASIINDVSALTYDPDALGAAADLRVPVILMHAQGDPKTMQDAPHYDDVVEEVMVFLKARIEACVDAGMKRELLVADPGIGFGKTLDHNLALLANLGRFHDLGVPLMLGASRKRFIEMIDKGAETDQRMGGSLAAVAAGARAGVQIYRVHDVRETVQFLKVWAAMAQRR